jgi:DNA repair protein RAD50
METHRQTDRQEQVVAIDSLSNCICALQVGDQDSIVAEFKSVEGEKQDVVQQQNMMRGSLATIRDGIHRAQRDLASPNYRDIDMRYRKQLIELKTTEMANSDLDKYHKVSISDCCSWSNRDRC